MDDLTCTCPCGKARVTIAARPFARFYCHCTICQSVYRAPFADATILRGSAVRDMENVRFAQYRRPPALNRGTCVSCESPVVATGPFLAFIPTRNYPPSADLPSSAAHIFYHSRAGDIADDVPKYSGYWPSELAVTRLILRGLFGAPSRG